MRTTCMMSLAAVLLFACSESTTGGGDAGKEAGGADQGGVTPDQAARDQGGTTPDEGWTLPDRSAVDEGWTLPDRSAVDEGWTLPDVALPDRAPPRPDLAALDSAPAGDAGAAPCTAMDAKGVGGCKMILGYKWDGSTCSMISGCSCSGKDCSRLYKSTADCQKAQAHCNKPRCTAWDAIGVGPCLMLLGYKWDGTKCVSIGGCSCSGVDCAKLYSSQTACQTGQAPCKKP